MLPFRPSTQALSRAFSFSSMFVSTLIAFSAPLGYIYVSKRPAYLGSRLTPSSMGTEKKSQPVSSAIFSPPGTPGRYTKLGSTIPFVPLTALRSFSAKLQISIGVLDTSELTYRKPAYAMERVAEPVPSFALTTSSPPNCTRLTRSGILSAGIVTEGFAWLNKGTMVSPE